MAAAALYKSCGLLPEAVHSLEAALEERPADAAVSQALAVVLTDLGARSDAQIESNCVPKAVVLLLSTVGACLLASTVHRHIE